MRLRLISKVIVTGTETTVASHGEARMTPCWTPNQGLLNPKVSIEPSAWRHEYFDYWGTAVVAFNVPEAHRRLCVAVTTELDFTVPVPPAAPSPDWSGAVGEELQDAHAEYLQLPEDLPISPAWQGLRDESASVAQFVAGLTSSAVVPGQGDELVHGCLDAIRQAGVPARYVAGFLIPAELENDEQQPGRVHGWLQYWDQRWQAWDPNLACAPDARHVVVGFGRSRADVPVLLGVHNTRSILTSTCEVSVQRLS